MTWLGKWLIRRPSPFVPLCNDSASLMDYSSNINVGSTGAISSANLIQIGFELAQMIAQMIALL